MKQEEKELQAGDDLLQKTANEIKKLMFTEMPMR